jgi:YHS domain-containing protein
MKVINPLFVFVLIGTLGLVSWACGNSKTAGEQHQTAMNQEHSDYTEGEAQTPKSFDSMPAPGTKAICPVMDSEFEVKEDSEFSVYNEKTYVFCCPGCKPKFDENPEQYANK